MLNSHKKCSLVSSELTGDKEQYKNLGFISFLLRGEGLLAWIVFQPTTSVAEVLYCSKGLESKYLSLLFQSVYFAFDWTLDIANFTANDYPLAVTGSRDNHDSSCHSSSPEELWDNEVAFCPLSWAVPSTWKRHWDFCLWLLWSYQQPSSDITTGDTSPWFMPHMTALAGNKDVRRKGLKTNPTDFPRKSAKVSIASLISPWQGV